MDFDKDKTLKEIGAELDRIRIEKGLSYSQLSADSGIDSSNLSRILTGKVDGRISSLVKILKALGVDWKQLFS